MYGRGCIGASRRSAAQENDRSVPQNRLTVRKPRTALGVLSENDQRLRSMCPAALKPPPVALGAENGLSSGNSISPGPGAPAAFVSNPNLSVYMEEGVEEEEEKEGVVGGGVMQEVEVSDHRNLTSELETQLGEVEGVSKQPEHCCLDVDLSEVSPMLVDSSVDSQPNHDCSPDNVDYLAVEEYAEDIYRYLREAEVKHRPRFGYMQKQPDITTGMRSILVDWLVEVSEEYSLQTETLYLAVNYLDRFLSCMSVLRGKLQLVGTAAMLIASKYEEIYPPEIDEFIYVTDDTYTKKQLLRMEHLLLKVLTFDMAVPTINQFLIQFLKEEETGENMSCLAMYVAELSLLEVDLYLKYTPSIMAAAAYCLANYTVNQTFWPDSLVVFTGYSLSEIGPCLNDLHKTFLQSKFQPQQAIREKYRSAKYMKISLIESPANLPLYGLV